MRKVFRSGLRIILVLLGFSSLMFQVVMFVFSVGSRSIHQESRLFSHDIPHFFTIIICIWFIVHILKLSKVQNGQILGVQILGIRTNQGMQSRLVLDVGISPMYCESYGSLISVEKM